MTETTEIEFGLQFSKNFNTASIKFVKQTFEYENEADLSEKIREKYAFLRRELNYQMSLN